MSLPFRHASAFGKRIEYYIVGLTLKEGLDVYLPLVDDEPMNDLGFSIIWTSKAATLQPVRLLRESPPGWLDVIGNGVETNSSIVWGPLTISQ